MPPPEKGMITFITLFWCTENPTTDLMELGTCKSDQEERRYSVLMWMTVSDLDLSIYCTLPRVFRVKPLQPNLANQDNYHEA